MLQTEHDPFARRDLYERRGFDMVEFRVDGDEKAAKILGHASMFNQRYQLFEYDGWRYLEEVAPGAFAKTIQEGDIRALFNHDVNLVLGRNKAGTLKLWEDQRGLAYEIDPPDTQTIRDLVLAPMRRGDVTQSSFGFQIIKDRIETNRDEKYTLRTILETKLWDVSPVTFPASPTTDAAVRSALVGAGLNFDEITIALLKTRAGLPLSPEDSERVRGAIAALQSHLPAEPGEPEDRSDGEPPDGTLVTIVALTEAHSLAVAMRRRQLELIAHT